MKEQNINILKEMNKERLQLDDKYFPPRDKPFNPPDKNPKEANKIVNKVVNADESSDPQYIIP
ncbi:10373_t:CDS:2 [Acaulospora morrowiae]|uniref:10373_t:CDS:1 n=1 Tax=Acaulospora morrowiae TaxID=94023 RepID=A0A9N8WAH1_9GLOM|nr:10373_t:CDS:2 [Acaulospora morrowiae]